MATEKSKKTESIWAIVPAAGSGNRMGSRMRSRMGQGVPKQYLTLQGKCVIEHTLERLLSLEILAGVVVTLSPSDKYFETLAIAQHPKVMITEGGRERADSVLAGLSFLETTVASAQWALVHDAARCCVRAATIERLISETLKRHNFEQGNIKQGGFKQTESAGGILAVPASDTLKRVESLRIHQTVDRSTIWHAQTPQLFPRELLQTALLSAQQKKAVITDEASAVELYGLQAHVVEGDYDNIKITHPMDLFIAEAILSEQSAMAEKQSS